MLAKGGRLALISLPAYLGTDLDGELGPLN